MVIDEWKYDTVSGQSVTVRRERGKGTRPWRDPGGVEGPFLPLDHDVLDVHSPVVIVEGERARDAIWASGVRYPVTCWISGAQNWAQTDWGILANSRIILWPDRDQVGFDAMEALAEHLSELGADVWAADIPETEDGEPDSWDAADCDPGQIEGILDRAYQMENTASADVIPGTLPAENECFPAWQPIPGMLETGAVTIWHGAPKCGKSAYALLAAAQLLSGKEIAGFPTAPAPRAEQDREHEILMVWIEEQQSTSDMRRWAICRHHEVAPEIWQRSHWIYQLEQQGADDRMAVIEGVARRIKPSVIMVDNLARLAPKAENDSEQATALISDMERIAQSLGVAVVLIHHDRKMPGQDGGKASGDEMLRGTSALTGAARVIVQIKAIGRDFVAIEGGGTNNAQSADDVRLRKHSVTVNTFPTVALGVEAKPDLFAGIPPQKVRAMHADLLSNDAQDRRHDIRSAGWAGIAMGEFLGLEMGGGKRIKECSDEEMENRDRMKAILEGWTKTGLLTVKDETWQDEKQRREKSGKAYVRGKTGWESS